MRHLTSEQLVDLAEGVGTDALQPHLQSCGACRRQLAELRATLSAAGDVDVPEPSPLFWDHFSARVHDAVEAERANGPSASWRWSSWRAVIWRTGFWPMGPWRLAPLWVGSIAVVVLAVGMMTRGPVSDAPPARGPVAVVADAPAEPPAVVDDASLSLVADLVTDLDWDAAVEAGLTTRIEFADDSVTALSEGERRELHQLLRVELGEDEGKYKGQSTKSKVS